VTSIKEEETQKLLRVEEELHKRIISQEKAISALARAIRRSRAGLKSPNRPIGSFLFLGPTGVGKTEMARTLAQFLFGSTRRSSASICRSTWRSTPSPSSSARLRLRGLRGGRPVDRARQAFALFGCPARRNREGAPDVFNILLQVFEDGQLTDGLGNTVDFKNVILIMTSNIGARHLQKKQGLGFASDREDIVSDKVEEL